MNPKVHSKSMPIAKWYFWPCLLLLSFNKTRQTVAWNSWCYSLSHARNCSFNLCTYSLLHIYTGIRKQCWQSSRIMIVQSDSKATRVNLLNVFLLLVTIILIQRSKHWMGEKMKTENFWVFFDCLPSSICHFLSIFKWHTFWITPKAHKKQCA